MKPKVRLLLPATSAEELDVFLHLPAASLVAPGNFPKIATLCEPTLCLLAPTDVLRRAEQSQRWKDLGRHVELKAVHIDDLVLDIPSEVTPALAYARGISACGAAATETTFLFLQPNLVLADGSLIGVLRGMQDGAAASTATYLRVDRHRLAEALDAAATNPVGFSPRPLLETAFKCLAPIESASVVNNQMFLSARGGRFHWKHDASTLVSHDFTPALVALRPTRVVNDAPGFRDVAFAEATCPGVHPRHLGDSDLFLGIELTDDASSRDISVGQRPPQITARELSNWTTSAQRGAAVHQTVFHARDVPGDLGQSSATAAAWITSLLRLMGPPQPALEHPRWVVAFYLWAVRRFELGKGALPASPFPALLARPRNGGGLRRRVLGFETLAPLARNLRRLLLGRAPLVTILHPDWLDYRPIKSSLRAGADAGRQSILYVGDGMAVLARVLGTPAFSPAELLDGTYGRPGVAAGSLDLVIIEASMPSLYAWVKLVQKVMAGVRPGGRIVVFHHDPSDEAGRGLKDALSRGTLELSRLAVKQVSVAMVGATAYRSWVRRAYPLALDYIRRQDPMNVFKGMALFSLATALSFLLNVACSRSARYDTSAGSWSSVTITIEL